MALAISKHTQGGESDSEENFQSLGHWMRFIFVGHISVTKP